MMQQPQMTPQDINIALGQLEAQAGQLDTQAEQLEALQEAQAAGMMIPQQAAPMQYSPFPMQAMQQRRPPGSHLLLGAVVMAGLYLLNKSYKLDIQKRPDTLDKLLE